MSARIAKNQKLLKLVKLVPLDTIQVGEEKAEGIGRICRKHITKNNSSISEYNKEKNSRELMLAICHLCYFMEFDNDDYVNQTINLPQSVMYTTPQNYFSESFFFYIL